MCWYRFHNILPLLLLLYFIGVTDGAEISVRGSEYIKFDLLGTNTSILETSDSLSLRFRTFKPHGLIFYAHGVGYFITLELYHCKLRYAINLAEQFTFIFGDNLCDNQWHSVLITRDERKVTIHLDKEPTRIVDIKLSQLYEGHVTIFLNVRIYVGGTWKVVNELKNLLVSNFIGCLSDVLFNAYHLISDAEMEKNGYTTAGSISYTCPSTEFKPLGFVNDKAYLNVPSLDPDKVSVRFNFRTYDKSGVLMYRDGPKISVHLYLENGKIKFEFYIPGMRQITLDTETWIDADFNDGAWHSVEASIDTSVMTFRVDNGTKAVADAHKVLLGALANSLDFENVTYIGGGTYYKGMYGFVGCIKDLCVNGVEMSELPKDVKKVSVEVGKCSTRSLCFPSPCQYNSRCEQASSNFTCKCKRFYRGRYCEIPLFQASCQGYKELGMNEDAFCRLDTDGKGPCREFRVLCNMTDGKDAVTIVNHTRSNRLVKVQDESEAFSPAAQSWIHLMKYGGVEWESLRALIDESDHCRQYVVFNCIDTQFLMARANGKPGAYWVSYDGTERHYWGGSKRGGVTCACGRTLSCYDRKKMCNCDTGDGVWRQDKGYLTNKEHLPVAAIYFPITAKNSNFTVGPLECFGRRKTLTRETEEQNFFDIACQPLVTKPPPMYPGQRKLTTTVKPKDTSEKTTFIITTKSTTLTDLKSSNASAKLWSKDNATKATPFGKNYSNSGFTLTKTIIRQNSSLFLANPTDHMFVDVANVKNESKKYNYHDWWFILILTASTFIVILAFVLILLMSRNKRKNGVWCEGLFVFAKQQQLPKIEIYRHSIGEDSPDILHMEDFKNTKVMDVHFHRGHFIAKKSAKKKTVTFKGRW